MRKKLHLVVMIVIGLSMTFTTTLFAQEADALAQFNASLANKEAVIKVEENLGSEDNYTVINLDYPVTIEGNGLSTFYGSFIIQSDGVTIKNLIIRNRGDEKGQSTKNRSGIYVYAKNVNILNNNFTNGLVDKVGLSNGVQIMSPEADNEFASYVIENNTFTGHDNQVPSYTSSAIVVAQGYKPASIKPATAESIVVSDNDVLNIFKHNLFTNNSIDFTHQDWSKSADEVVLKSIQQDDFVDAYKAEKIKKLKEDFDTIEPELHQENKEFIDGFEERMIESVEMAGTILDVDTVIELMSKEIRELLSDYELMEQAIANAHDLKTEDHVKRALDLVDKYHPEEGKEQVIEQLQLLLEKEAEEPVEEEIPQENEKDEDDVLAPKEEEKNKKDVDKDDKSKVPHTGLSEQTVMYLSLITLSLLVFVTLYKRKRLL